MKNSVIIYRSFYDALSGLPDEDFAALFRAIIEYGLNEVEKEIPQHLKPFFILIQPQITANLKRHTDGMKGAEHGAKGGRPKKYENTDTENNPIPLSEKTPVGLFDETPKEKEKEKEKENVKEKEKVDIDFERMLQYWNDHCGNMPKIIKLSDKRKAAITARYKEHGKEGILKAIQKAEKSDFLQGKKGDWAGANFDWVFTASSFVKILEGNYDNKNSNGSVDYISTQINRTCY